MNIKSAVIASMLAIIPMTASAWVATLHYQPSTPLEERTYSWSWCTFIDNDRGLYVYTTIHNEAGETLYGTDQEALAKWLDKNWPNIHWTMPECSSTQSRDAAISNRNQEIVTYTNPSGAYGPLKSLWLDWER